MIKFVNAILFAGMLTMNYLANFEDDEKRKWAEILLPENDE